VFHYAVMSFVHTLDARLEELLRDHCFWVFRGALQRGEGISCAHLLKVKAEAGKGRGEALPR